MQNLLEDACTLRRDSFGKLLFITLVYMDILLTMVAVSLGLSELNTFVRALFQNPIYLIVFKVVPPPIIAWLVPSKLLLPSAFFMSAVIAWNCKELLVFLF